MVKKLKNRKDIDKKYKWDIGSMYPDEKQWEKDIEKALKDAESFSGLAGQLTTSGSTLLDAFKKRDSIWQTMEKAYVYARMKRDEDNEEQKYQAMCGRAGAYMAKISALCSFFVPELLKAPKDKLMTFMEEEPGLSVYRFAVTDILRQKKHILSKSEENIMAQMGEMMSATNEIFTMLNNADLKFGNIKDEKGRQVQLTHGNYINFMESRDRRVRRAAYKKMYTCYRQMINTIGTAYNYNTKTDVVNSRIRRYSSARAAALSGDNIPAAVYDNLVGSVNDSLPVLHKYMALRKKALKNNQLKMYDVYFPLTKLNEKKIPFQKGIDIMTEGLSPLGGEYISAMKKGISRGWIDVYENQGKTSGAYSFGSYDSKPFILLNYTDTLKDVFTLVHEMGHSMHSFFTRKNQPYIYGGHSIFTAEVASTVNENLLMKYLLSKEKDAEMKKYLLNMHIEGFRTTLFRQTMFAEFEQLSHEAVEAGKTLTADWLCDEYDKLNSKYFGPSVCRDDLIKYEWARIPHFYNAFYVYKYATGYSAASAISDMIIGDTKKRDDYIEFLKTGEKDQPIELLKIAGVDMKSTAPVESAMSVFKKLVEEFETLV
jgi:oligoendopeptidase F